ncbi:MAG: sodium:solute symporter family protein [Candidatus Methanoplasma sp.]|jgi:SSS family solute:Na+ symporter|nr:sodium:solute symporter family protein [Candidatus Methanoplasma sp.]
MSGIGGGVSIPTLAVMFIIFVTVTMLLGIYGYKNTKNNQEYLLGRHKSNSVIIALSYGSTFLSASAIIGFGGQAAIHGMGLIWLCFLNLFLGLFVAFVVFGTRVRKIGRNLGASTFADLLGKIYGSKGIRGFTAVIIVLIMPIYCAAVLKGGVNSLAVIAGLQEYYDYILIALAVIVGIYVVYGGIVAVMYNDALQATIMFIGMALILIVTFYVLGGVGPALSGLESIDPGTAGTKTLPGFNGWTDFADFGTPEWLTVVSTFILGVGIGALTQPQLVVRFMSAKDDKMLNRSLIIGSIFMIVIVGAAYTMGPLSNVYFMQEHGQIAAQWVTEGTDFIIPTFVLEIFKDIPMGDMFVSLFLLSLICAAISTLSALMHTIGTAGGHDLYGLAREGRKGKGIDLGAIGKGLHRLVGNGKPETQSLRVNRMCTAIVLVLVVVYCYLMPSDIIAKATSLFMGMTAAALLPAFAHGLYSKRPRKDAAFASVVAGTVSYLLWALFINASSSVFLPIYQWIAGQKVIFMSSNIQYVDALLVALPISVITMLLVLYLKKPVEIAKPETGTESEA